MTLLTIGHGTADQDELAARLTAADIALVVDVRIAPGSRRHPHVSRDVLEQWLPHLGVDYRWEKRLGGFRRLRPDSPDVALRNESFRAYAGHMRTPEFAAAIDEVLAAAATRRSALMCSETLWWRCHRRMISDYVLLARGVEVQHVLPSGSTVKLESHRATDGVRVRADGELVYDVAGSMPLPLD